VVEHSNVSPLQVTSLCLPAFLCSPYRALLHNCGSNHTSFPYCFTLTSPSPKNHIKLRKSLACSQRLPTSVLSSLFLKRLTCSAKDIDNVVLCVVCVCVCVRARARCVCGCACACVCLCARALRVRYITVCCLFLLADFDVCCLYDLSSGLAS